MNRAYRLVWNHARNAFVPAPEFARGRRKRNGVSLLTGVALATFALNAHALPTDGQVTAGSGSIATTGATMTVNQGSQNLSLNWASFNIAANEAVRFNQPNSSAIALNRVLGTDGSQILGSLSANGQVFVLNPNGVLFGPNAQVNVGGLVASTLNLSDSDFLAGKYRFTGAGGSVLNQGTINAGSYVALLGGQVGNEGVIVARLGKVALAAGNAVTLDLAGDKLLSLQVDEGALNALAENKGLIKADGGEVLLTARSADALLQTVVNNEGVIEARTVENRNGTIRLLGDMQSGTVKVGGTLDASAPEGGDGGFIETSAASVELNNPTVTAAAPYGKGGQWLIDPTDITIDAAAAGTYATTLGGGTDVTVETVAGGADLGNITVAANIAKTAGTDATLTLKAHNNIVVNNGVSISSTSNKLNVVLNADSDSSGLGYIRMGSGSSIASNGGNLVMGGGACTTAGCTGAAAGGNVADGIELNSASLTSGGGDITLVGSSTSDSGIRATNSTINSGGGSLLLRGTTTSAGANRGIYLLSATVESGAGSLTLEGRGTVWYGGIHLESATVGNASQTGDITLAAQSNTGMDSIWFTNCGMGCNAPKLQGAGTLTLKPLDNYTTIGLAGGAGDFNLSATELGYIQSGFTDITVGGRYGGAMTVGGAWTVPTSANLKLENFNNVGIATHGIALNGALTLGTGKFLGLNSDGAVTQTAAISAPSLIVSGLGNFTLDNAGNNVTTLAAAIQNNAQDNSLSFTNGGALTVGTVDGESGVSAGDNATLTADGITLSQGIWGSGTLTLQPRTAATTIGLGTGAAGTLSLGYTALNRIDTGFSQVVIGRADGTGRIEVGDMGGTPFKSDLTLRAPGAGGDIYVGTPSMGYALETGSGADAGSITLIAGRNITNDGSIYTRGGHVILNANAAGAGGNILMDTNASIATNGGNLVMGGGTCTTTDCTGAATGYDVSYHDGIYLNGASLDAGAGAIVLRGAGSTTGGMDTTGIFISNGSNMNAIGITLTGTGGNGANYGYGVYAGNAALNANSGTLTVTGTGGTGSGATNDGISFAGTTTLSSGATGNALILSATSFANYASAGAGTLSTPNGRWLVYSASPSATTKGGLTSNFRHYNASYAGYAPASVTETGNGFIYASAAGNLAVNTTLASGAASHTYGGTPTATYGYTLSGTFADSEDNASNIGVAGTAAYANAPTAASPAGSYTVTYANGLTSTAGYGFTAGTGLAYTVNAAPVTTTGEVAAPGAPANGYSGSLTSAKRLPYTESANGTNGQEGTDREKLAEDLRRLDEPHETPAARDGTGADRPFTIQGDGIRLPKGLPQARL